jgi:ribonuclease P protein component
MDVKFLQEEKQKDAGSLQLATNRSTVNTAVDFRLRKSEIVRGYKSFGKIFGNGKFIAADYIRCYYSSPNQIPPQQCKVGFAIKKARNAVERNKLKRSLRESFRLHKNTLHDYCIKYATGLECVLLIDPKKMPEAHSFHDINGLIEGLFLQLIQLLEKR